MCEVTLEKKLKTVPVMLIGDDLNYYANNVQNCRDFCKAMER